MIILKNVEQVINIALPLAAMGLLAVLFVVRHTARKTEKAGTFGDYGPEGMCFGMCLGTAIGAALGNKTGLGITLGMLAGLVIGLCIHKDGVD